MVHDTITFGGGNGDFVNIGADTATATAVATDGDATATTILSFAPVIQNDQVTFGSGVGDFVQSSPTVNVTANATATGSATDNVNVTLSAGDISSDTIRFGDGANDFVAVGPTSVAVTAAANATGNAYAEVAIVGNGGGTITDDSITYGNGNGDYVQVADAINVNDTQSASGDTSTTLVDISLTIAAASISDDIIIGIIAAAASYGSMNDNNITFGGGSGDYVYAAGDFSGNTIVFGNGTGDYVSVSEGTSSSNSITLGNGNNDSVTLPGSATGSGGDTIITGTGNSDTVTVGNHTAPDTFGFSMGTGGTAIAQTTVTGAELGDHIVVGNSTTFALGNTLVQDGEVAGLSTVHDFGGVKADHTYTADNGVSTFVVTDSLGHLGGVELAGSVFEHNLVASHVLTLGV